MVEALERWIDDHDPLAGEGRAGDASELPHFRSLRIEPVMSYLPERSAVGHSLARGTRPGEVRPTGLRRPGRRAQRPSGQVGALAGASAAVCGMARLILALDHPSESFHPPPEAAWSPPHRSPPPSSTANGASRILMSPKDGCQQWVPPSIPRSLSNSPDFCLKIAGFFHRGRQVMPRDDTRRDPRYDVLFEPIRDRPGDREEPLLPGPALQRHGVPRPRPRSPGCGGSRRKGGWGVVCTEEGGDPPHLGHRPLHRAPALGRPRQSRRSRGSRTGSTSSARWRGLELAYNGPNGPNSYGREGAARPVRNAGGPLRTTIRCRRAR